MNKYETLTKPYKLFDKQIDELNKVEKRPFDKMIEIVNGVDNATDTYIGKLKKEIAQLKTEKARAMELLGEAISKYKELKNLCSKEQLAELDYIIKRNKEGK